MWMNSSAFDFCTRCGINGIKPFELSAHIALSPKHQRIVTDITRVLLVQHSLNRTLNYNNDEGWTWIDIMEEQQSKNHNRKIFNDNKNSQRAMKCHLHDGLSFTAWHWIRVCYKDSLENQAKQCITLTFSCIFNSNLFYNEKLEAI